MNDPSMVRLATEGAAGIRDAFDLYQRAFKQITHCAQGRFEARDWRGAERDSVERLDLYKRVIDRIVAESRAALAGYVHEKAVWAEMRAAYSGLITGRNDAELAETFFNSVTRRIFATVGVDQGIEYVDSGSANPPNPARPISRTYPRSEDTAALIAAILADCPFRTGYADLAGDARLAAAQLDMHVRAAWDAAAPEAVEMIRPIFYRNKGAYLVGRLRHGERSAPLILTLLNTERGITVDAILLTEDEASNVFSYTRSYFQVETEHAYLLVDFLKSIMPWKRRAELYTAIGHNKHGKTELYRDLYCHLLGSDDRFELARGERGMVMVVFTMPSFDVVFKVIKDTFPYPKRTTRGDVMSRYQLVFKRDRAGRLVDAQEFEHLAFARERFTDEALAELLSQCSNTVSLIGDTVDIQHLYTERRLTPLNLYLREHEPSLAAEAVIDYGQAVKDLAATNIFPGDLFMKNFGVNRHGRVIFYDYDELTLLTDCNFRVIPRSRDAYDEFDAQPWYSVAENDVFPEEFRSFLGLDRRLMDVFCGAHGDLFEVTFWRDMQARLRAGEVLDLYPYPQNRRLHR